MGLIRLLLAISVAAAHTGNFFWMDARQAVLLFYVISGYLITAVLNTAYADNVRGFYINRALRIYGPALAVMVPLWTLIFLTHSQDNISGVGAIDVFTFVSSLTIVGQDFAFLFGLLPGGALVWQPFGDPGAARSLAYFQPNDPMFSLAIELYFYLLAPFVLRSLNRTLLFLSIGAAYHIALAVTGLNSVGWSYHVAISAWFYFGSGALTWHLSRAMDTKMKLPIYGAIVCIILLEMLFHPISVPLGYTLLLLGLPALSALTRNISADAFLGDLSYPVYLVHVPVISVLGADFAVGEPRFLGVAAISLVLAVLLRWLVEMPIDRIRNRVRGGPVGAAVASSPAP